MTAYRSPPPGMPSVEEIREREAWRELAEEAIAAAMRASTAQRRGEVRDIEQAILRLSGFDRVEMAWAPLLKATEFRFIRADGKEFSKAISDREMRGVRYPARAIVLLIEEARDAILRDPVTT